MRAKEHLARFLNSSKLLALADSWRAGPRDRVVILAYHRVMELGDESRFPFDPELVSASPEEFRWQMQYLRRHWSPMTLAGLLDVIDGRAELPPRAVIVTFDDGFQDNYQYAFPILRDLGIPAAFFVATDYVDAAQTFWFDRVSHLLFSMPVGELALPRLGLRVQVDGVPSRRAASEQLVEALKRVPDPERRELVAELEVRYGRYADAGMQYLSRTLTSAQIHEMSRAGMEFGSHSASHPILARLDPASLRDELTRSRAWLEALLGKPVQILSYPNGLVPDISAAVISAARAAGYRLALAYLRGSNRIMGLDPFCLRRQPVERYLTRSYFMTMLNLAGLFNESADHSA